MILVKGLFRVMYKNIPFVVDNPQPPKPPSPPPPVKLPPSLSMHSTPNLEGRPPLSVQFL